MFPRLYSLSLDQGQAVGEVGEWINSEWRWSLKWRRARFEWETPMEADLSMILSRVILKKNIKDNHTWGKEKSRLFSVKSAYECLAKQIRDPQSEVFKLLWKVKAFPSVVTTAWRVLVGRIPTRVDLSMQTRSTGMVFVL